MSDLIQRLRVDHNLDCGCQSIQEEAADQLEEYRSQLRDIRRAALPDPHDERDISVEWLRALINRHTPPPDED